MLKTGMAYIVADNIYSPLGTTSDENFSGLLHGRTGVKRQERPGLSDQPFVASLFSEGTFTGEEHFTRFEQMLVCSITDALKNVPVDPSGKETALIISTTKGNISLLETMADSPELRQRVALTGSAKKIAGHFKFATSPFIVSNACISGLLGMIMGMRLIRSGQYQNVVVAGADVISKFVLSGFQSFQAVSDRPCRPFDAARDGINLGEGAATVVLSAHRFRPDDIRITGGSVSNDANHISGPSRTGEELYQAIGNALQDAGIKASDIDLVSAHGTATVYNDEMEARAIHLAGLQKVPVNSLKGFYGHTLGAAGLIETVASVWSMREGVLLPTPGYENPGVSLSVNVSNALRKGPVKNCLKTASGFGGCNAAITLTQ